MWKELKRVFRRLSPIEVVAAELYAAEMSLLEHQTASEFSLSMVRYNETRIKRLRATLASQEALNV